MKKELPGIYTQGSIKKFQNSQTVFYGNEASLDMEGIRYTEKKKPNVGMSIDQKIMSIFSSPNFIYRANVEVVMGGRNHVKQIVGKNGGYLITMENELIPIASIDDIRAI